VRATLFGSRWGAHRGRTIALQPEHARRLDAYATVNPRYQQLEDERGCWFRQIPLEDNDLHWTLPGFTPTAFAASDLDDPLIALRRGLLVPLPTTLWPIAEAEPWRVVAQRPWNSPSAWPGSGSRVVTVDQARATWETLLRMTHTVPSDALLSRLLPQTAFRDGLDTLLHEWLREDDDVSGDRVVKALRVLCQPSVRMALGQRHVTAVIMLSMTSPRAQVRRWAATALTRSADPDASAALLASLDDPDDTVQEAAASALAASLAERPHEMQTFAERLARPTSLLSSLRIAQVLIELGASTQQPREILESSQDRQDVPDSTRCIFQQILRCRA
jgi:hypothetical protein